MADQLDDTIDDAGLTKPKKNRSEAQKAATERMRKALEAKQTSSGGLSKDEKKLRLQAIKEQLNGPLKKNMDKAPKPAPEPAPEPETESEEEAPPPPAPKKKEVKVVSQPKKQPKVVYESASESEEEVIVVKKKKKPKKKTIIYEDATESEEEEPVKPIKKERETKTQQNSASKFKVTPSIAEKPKGPIYYFE
tara:strand:- start:122 stop:700 length:579 start_codon:yes stop_codon:yes gene_type:complete